MSVISIDTAIEHLRAEDDDRAFVQGLLEAAEGAACDFMQRRIFADDSALAAGRAAAVAMRAQARAAYATAFASAQLIEDWEGQSSAMTDADFDLKQAMAIADAMARGLVLDSTVQAACLLIVGHLYTNREDVVAGAGTKTAVTLPQGSRFLLAPYRVQMGV